MDWISVPLILAFIVIFVMNNRSRHVESEMYYKYNIKTWHNGYFKHRKMLKALSEADRIYYKKECKKYGRVQLYTLLFVIIYCITVGIIKTKLGYK